MEAAGTSRTRERRKRRPEPRQVLGASALWLGALSHPGHVIRRKRASEPARICWWFPASGLGRSRWCSQAALRKLRADTPRPPGLTAELRRGLPSRISGSLVSVGGIVGCFVGEGKILVAGRLL